MEASHVVVQFLLAIPVYVAVFSPYWLDKLIFFTQIYVELDERSNHIFVDALTSTILLDQVSHNITIFNVHLSLSLLILVHYLLLEQFLAPEAHF